MPATQPTVELQARIARALKRARPETGPFYWAPKPTGDGVQFIWDIVPFYNCDYGEEIGHVQVWSEVIRIMAAWWNKPVKSLLKKLEDAYTGIPRGRVVKMAGEYGIAHGGDKLIPSHLNSLRRLYVLPPETRPFLDEHERMIPGDPELFQQIFGIKTGLTGVCPFDNEYEP